MTSILKQLFSKSPSNKDGRGAFDLGYVVKLSSSGQMSVSIEDIAKTKRYNSDLEALKRIANSHRHSARTA